MKQVQIRQLELLQEINSRIGSALDMNDLLKITLKEGLKAIRTNAGSIMLIDPINNQIEIRGRVVEGKFVSCEAYPWWNLGKGVAGYVATSGEAYHCPDISADSRFTGSVKRSSFRSLLSVPIVSHGRVLGVINANGPEPDFFKRADGQFLGALASHVALAIEAQRMRDIDTIITSSTLEEMLVNIIKLACVLTGSVSGTIMLLDADSGRVIQSIKLSAAGWSQFEPRDDGLMRSVATSGKPLLIEDAPHDPRVKLTTKARGIKALLGVPLKVQRDHRQLAGRVRTLGALFVDQAQKETFSSRDQELLESLAGRVAFAIENVRLYEEVARERDYSQRMSNQLLVLHEITQQMQAVQTDLDLPGLFDSISQLAANLFGVESGGILLLDEQKEYLTFKGSFGLSQQIIQLTRLLDGQSISGLVVKTGQPLIIHNYPHDPRFNNPAAKNEGILAIISTPLRIDGEIIGALQAHSKSNPFAFDANDLFVLSMMADQAMIAIRNARLFEQTYRRVEELEHMRQVTEALAGVTTLNEAMQQIVQSAQWVLRADSASIFVYNPAQSKFTRHGSVTSGIVAGTFKEIGNGEPWQTESEWIMQRGWVGVANVDAEENASFLAEPIRQFLKDMGIYSFQGVALKVDEEKVGVLYVNYNHSRRFSNEERRTAQAFADQVMLALKKAKLLDQLHRTHRAATLVAKVMTLENLRDMLDLIVFGMQAILDCDVVTLWPYDAERKEFEFPPALAGVNHPEVTLGLGRVPDQAVVRNILPLHDLHVAEDRLNDPLLAGPFAQRESLVSSVGAPLSVPGRKVGGLIVSYRTPHHFSQEELNHIRLFANQAAVAIRNKQLYEREQRQAKVLEALNEAGSAVNKSLKLNNILAAIVKQARRLASNYRLESCVSYLALVEKGWLNFKASDPPERLTKRQAPLSQLNPEYEEEFFNDGLEREIFIGDIDLESDASLSIPGRAVKLKEPVLVGDVSQDDDYQEYDPEVHSELAVPIKFEGLVIGTISIEHTEKQAFDFQDQQALETLAGYAAIAIHNARLFEQGQIEKKRLQAVAWISQKAAANLDTPRLLRTVTRRIEQVMIKKQVKASILLYKEEENCLVFDPDWQGSFPQKIEVAKGYVQSLDRGICGYVARHKKSHLEGRVDNFPGYVRVLTETQSELCVPICHGKERELIGVLDLQSPKVSIFEKNDEQFLQTLADQLAVFIKRAQLHHEVQKYLQQAKKRIKSLQALNKAGRAVTSTLDLDRVLQAIAEQAGQLVRLARYSRLALVNNGKLGYKATYPPRHLAEIQKFVASRREQRSIAFRVVKTGQSQLVGNVLEDPDYLEVDPQIHSQLAVPIKAEGKVIGVITVEHPDYHAFSKEEDQRTLEALAGYAAIAIQKARQYEDLRHTRSLLLARTAVAWMGLDSAIWRHDINTHAATIHAEVGLLQADWGQKFDAKSEARLAKIKNLARRIEDKPVTPSLFPGENIESLPLNKLLQDCLERILQDESAQFTQQELDFKLSGRATVQASRIWLEQLFDILINNALEAMQGVARPVLKVSTRAVNGSAEIVFTDTGRGISEEIQAKLFNQQITKSKGGPGLGMGLLLAQTIAHAYDGEVSLHSTTPAGTSMLVTLPIEIP